MGSCQWPSVKVEVCSEDIHIIVTIPQTVSFIDAKTVERRERGMQTDGYVSGVCSGSALGKQKERKDESTADAQIGSPAQFSLRRSRSHTFHAS